MYQNRLITADYQPMFNGEANRWEVEVEDEWIDLEEEVKSELAECNAFLQNDIGEKAVLLIDNDVYKDHADVSGESFELLPVIDDNYAEALKSLVAKYNEKSTV